MSLHFLVLLDLLDRRAVLHLCLFIDGLSLHNYRNGARKRAWECVLSRADCVLLWRYTLLVRSNQADEPAAKERPMAERILTLRELNRATLARQLLLERASVAPLAAIRQVAGLQGQLANPPYMGLWSRLQAFQKADLTGLLERREVVRTSMMRRTLHLTTAEDYLRFRPALAALHARHLESFFGQAEAPGLTRERLLAEVQVFLREKPR